MKKLFSIILAFTLIIPCLWTLSACGKEKEPSNQVENFTGITEYEANKLYNDVLNSFWSRGNRGINFDLDYSIRKVYTSGDVVSNVYTYVFDNDAEGIYAYTRNEDLIRFFAADGINANSVQIINSDSEQTYYNYFSYNHSIFEEITNFGFLKQLEEHEISSNLKEKGEIYKANRCANDDIELYIKITQFNNEEVIDTFDLYLRLSFVRGTDSWSGNIDYRVSGQTNHYKFNERINIYRYNQSSIDDLDFWKSKLN